eukprot:scaffold6062_cov74-Cyclotella_meneghiniana.AAC.2
MAHIYATTIVAKPVVWWDMQGVYVFFFDLVEQQNIRQRLKCRVAVVGDNMVGTKGKHFVCGFSGAGARYSFSLLCICASKV